MLVQHEVDRLAVVLLDQLLELQQRLGEGVVVVELDRAVQGDRLLGVARRRTMETTAIAAAKSAVLGVQSIASSRDRVFWLCRYYAGFDRCPWIRGAARP